MGVYVYYTHRGMPVKKKCRRFQAKYLAAHRFFL
jgi:hypothetical protein